MKAIVYCSGTGHTERYARALGEISGLPVYPLETAMKELAADTNIFFMTWVKAGNLVKCGPVSARFLICGIGASALNTGAGQDHDLRVRTGLASDFPLFMLPGGYDPSKVKGLDGMLMKLICWKLSREISKKMRPTELDLQMQKLLTEGGDLYDAEVLQHILAWMQVHKKTRE